MDTFVEQIIKKKKGAKEFAVITGISIAFLLLTLISIYFLNVVALLVVFGLGYGAWYLITSQNIEYEYSVTNGDIDIDEIIAQRKRKRVVSVVGSKIESLEPYYAETFASRPFDRRVIAAPSEHESDLWCFTYHSKKNGHTIVIFQPEQRVLEALQVGLQPLVLHEMNKKIKSSEK